MGVWKKGPGLLGPMTPLLGEWNSEALSDHPASKAACRRRFCKFGARYIRLEAI
jgi:hypothetical protein